MGPVHGGPERRRPEPENEGPWSLRKSTAAQRDVGISAWKAAREGPAALVRTYPPDT